MLGDLYIDNFLNIAKKSFDDCMFPSQWKTAEVHCIHNKGSIQDCRNYRTISLLNIASKLLESIACFQLDYFLNQHKNVRRRRNMAAGLKLAPYIFIIISIFISYFKSASGDYHFANAVGRAKETRIRKNAWIYGNFAVENDMLDQAHEATGSTVASWNFCPT